MLTIKTENDMIQRIQTLYLLAVAAMMATALFVPLAYFAEGTQEYTLCAFALRGGDMSQSTVYMGIVMALAAVVPLVNIFLFKRRMLQIRLCAVEMVLLLGSLAFIAIYYYLGSRMFAQAEFHAQGFRIAAVFPLVSMVLDYLAMRAIFRDELLVKSLDRIR